LRMDEKGIGDYIAAIASGAGVTPEQLISTDDNLLLEYDTPKNNAGGDRAPSVLAVSSTSADALALMTTKKPGLAEHLAAVKALAARDFASGIKSLNEAIARGDRSAIPLLDQAEKALREQQQQH
jgi:hypothetical protein